MKDFEKKPIKLWRWRNGYFVSLMHGERTVLETGGGHGEYADCMDPDSRDGKWIIAALNYCDGMENADMTPGGAAKIAKTPTRNERILSMRIALADIRRVASGEDQVAENDTEALQWIVDRIDNGSCASEMTICQRCEREMHPGASEVTRPADLLLVEARDCIARMAASVGPDGWVHPEIRATLAKLNAAIGDTQEATDV